MWITGSSYFRITKEETAFPGPCRCIDVLDNLAIRWYSIVEYEEM